MTKQEHRCEKHKHRHESVEAEIAGARGSIKVQRVQLEKKDAEIARLRQSLEREQQLCSHRETRFLQCHREHLRGQIVGERQMSQLVAVPMHQQLLEEQARRFRGTTRRLEARLAQDAEESQVRHREEWQTLELQEVDVHEAMRRSTAGRCSGDSLFEAGTQAEALEATLRQVATSHASAEATASQVFGKRHLLAKCVDEAVSHLARLELIADSGRHTGQRAREEANSIRATLSEAREEAAVYRNTLHQHQSASTFAARVQFDELTQSLLAAEAELREREASLTSLRAERGARAERQRSVEGRLALLEHTRRQKHAQGQARSDTIRQVQGVLNGRLAEVRADLLSLREAALREIEQCRLRCEQEAKQWLQGQGQQQRERGPAHQLKLAAATAQLEEALALQTSNVSILLRALSESLSGGGVPGGGTSEALDADSLQNLPHRVGLTGQGFREMLSQVELEVRVRLEQAEGEVASATNADEARAFTAEMSNQPVDTMYLQTHQENLALAESEIAEREASLELTRQQLWREQAKIAQLKSECRAESSEGRGPESLREGVQDLAREAGALQQRFREGLEALDEQCEAHCTESTVSQREEFLNMEAQLEVEINERRDHVEGTRAAELQAQEAAERRAAELVARVDQGRRSLAERHEACRHLERECAVAEQDELDSRTNLQRVEAELTEAQGERRRQREVLQERHSALRREHSEHLLEAERAAESELLAHGSLFQQSLSSISAAWAPEDDSGVT